jgi:hypothetical protein
MTEAARRVFAEAARKGHADANITGVVQLYDSAP